MSDAILTWLAGLRVRAVSWFRVGRAPAFQSVLRETLAAQRRSSHVAAGDEFAGAHSTPHS